VTVTEQTYTPIRGRVMRLTKLDSCGAPAVGPAGMLVTKGFISLELKMNYEDGDAITQKNAMGELVINEQPDSYLSHVEVTANLIGVDPDAITLLTGYQEEVDAGGNPVGFRAQGGVPILGGWAAEVWTDLAGVRCTATGVPQYGYTLVPFLRGGKLGDITHESGAVNASVTSSTREGGGWGVGPYNVVNTATTGAVTPGKLLTAIGPKDHFLTRVVTVAPPAVVAGLQALAIAS
jgi:hypothetical protein